MDVLLLVQGSERERGMAAGGLRSAASLSDRRAWTSDICLGGSLASFFPTLIHLVLFLFILPPTVQIYHSLVVAFDRILHLRS